MAARVRSRRGPRVVSELLFFLQVSSEPGKKIMLPLSSEIFYRDSLLFLLREGPRKTRLTYICIFLLCCLFAKFYHGRLLGAARVDKISKML